MDTLANMLVSMKNGSAVEKTSVVVPFSNIKYAIAQCLQKGGFIEGASKKTEKKNISVLEISLSYGADGAKINDVKRISKPSRRVYMGVRGMRPVKNGRGMIVLSTPKGIMSDKEAKKEQVGGEALFMIW